MSEEVLLRLHACMNESSSIVRTTSYPCQQTGQRAILPATIAHNKQAGTVLDCLRACLVILQQLLLARKWLGLALVPLAT